MQKKTVTIININGIHCRPSSVIVKKAMEFESELYAINEENSANLKSMLEIITLGAHCGTKITITAEGKDEAAAIQAIADLFETEFDYPDKK